jgi:ribosomal protein L11 methyltransferase
VTPEAAEVAVAALLTLAPEGFVEEDAELVVYADEQGLGALRGRFPQLRAEPVRPGWEEEWKRFHVPVVLGSLWIGPPWEDPPADLTAVVIDPGRAFGTGSHPTTRLCLEFLHKLDRGSVLDAGCGSGVLAIAAAKLGYGPVLALDRDEAAVQAARKNARLNEVELEVRRADLLADPLPAADLVLANIDLAGVNALGSRVVCRFVVTSGYCASDEPSIAGFGHRERRAAEDWAADLFVRE